jgi:uncharacterized protein with PQ loop repeat
MDATTSLGVVAGSFGVVMAASPMLQALRVVRLRRSDEVSIAFMAILFIGALAWLSYGIALGNWFMIVPNTVGMIASTTTMLVVLYWRRRESREA